MAARYFLKLVGMSQFGEAFQQGVPLVAGAKFPVEIVSLRFVEGFHDLLTLEVVQGPTQVVMTGVHQPRFSGCGGLSLDKSSDCASKCDGARNGGGSGTSRIVEPYSSLVIDENGVPVKFDLASQLLMSWASAVEGAQVVLADSDRPDRAVLTVERIQFDISRPRPLHVEGIHVIRRRRLTHVQVKVRHGDRLRVLFQTLEQAPCCPKCAGRVRVANGRAKCSNTENGSVCWEGSPDALAKSVAALKVRGRFLSVDDAISVIEQCRMKSELTSSWPVEGASPSRQTGYADLRQGSVAEEHLLESESGEEPVLYEVGYGEGFDIRFHLHIPSPYSHLHILRD